nr:cuticle protein 6-like [Cherax quadricarinatus]
MKLLVVLSLAWCCSAAQYVMPLSYMGYPFGQQYGSRDMYGYSTFGYHGINQNRHEFRHPDGRVVGHYSYIQPDGKPAVTFYEAGAGQGYRVRSNVLPVAETAELSAPVDNLVAPEPVQETPEVLQARAEFQAAFDEAKSRPVEEPSARKKRQVTFLTSPVTSAVNVKTGRR